MTINDIIQSVIAGGLLGMLGQGIRIAVGLKKFIDTNTAKVAQGKEPEEFKPGRMVISIFIGFVAGALGMIVKGASLSNNGDYSTESIITIIAVGYSGADFIEGVFNTYISKLSPQKQEQSTDTKKDQPLLVQDESALPSTTSQG
ncbi:MAG: hypothetical protein ABI405_07275 [Parafilimonas sp.]